MKLSVYSRSILTAALGVGLACALPSAALAKVKGQCSNCHTMHNSQNGSYVVSSLGNPVMSGVLLKNGCVGCHTTTGTDRRAAVGDSLVPAIIRPAQATNPLPGGYFDSDGVSTPTDTHYHNVGSIGYQQDSNIGRTPPGFDTTEGGAVGLTTTWDTQLRCAGTYGCHGDHSQADEGKSIAGGHHRQTAIGYRLLKGVAGTESTDYEIAENGYSGITTGLYTQTSGNYTISYLCNECHGKFHGWSDSSRAEAKNADGAWIRHPTDFQLSAASQASDAYATYGGTSPYNIEVPVGNSAITTVGYNTAHVADFGNWPAAGAGVVMCISCHYAHGGDYPDLLRWSYGTMQAGVGATGAGYGKGCFRCHTNKDE